MFTERIILELDGPGLDGSGAEAMRRDFRFSVFADLGGFNFYA